MCVSVCGGGITAYQPISALDRKMGTPWENMVGKHMTTAGSWVC